MAAKNPKGSAFRSTLAAVAVGIALATALGGCSSASPSATTSASAGATEQNPPGDIPDTQTFIAFDVPNSRVTLKVPEGWSRIDGATATSFTDKLNRIEIQVTSASTPPTEASIRAVDVPKLAKATAKFALGSIRTVVRKGGSAFLTTYQVDSAPDSVTGKVVRDAVERYTFVKGTTRVDLVLIAPTNADNVDPWLRVSDSVTFR